MSMLGPRRNTGRDWAVEEWKGGRMGRAVYQLSGDWVTGQGRWLSSKTPPWAFDWQETKGTSLLIQQWLQTLLSGLSLSTDRPTLVQVTDYSPAQIMSTTLPFELHWEPKNLVLLQSNFKGLVFLIPNPVLISACDKYNGFGDIYHLNAAQHYRIFLQHALQTCLSEWWLWDYLSITMILSDKAFCHISNACFPWRARCSLRVAHIRRLPEIWDSPALRFICGGESERSGSATLPSFKVFLFHLPEGPAGILLSELLPQSQRAAFHVRQDTRQESQLALGFT